MVERNMISRHSVRTRHVGWLRALALLCATGCALDKVEPVAQLPGAQGPASGGSAGSGSGVVDIPPVSGGDGGETEIDALQPLPAQLDLLFMIDNSVSMGDKQALLDLTNLSFLAALANPDCVAADGSRSSAPGPEVPCPPGQRRVARPITDVHVGIISSSLGDVTVDGFCALGAGVGRMDLSHLLGSVRGETEGVNASGFLEWQAGEDLGALNRSFQLLLRKVGEDGCGWEMSLEAWYRFLIDPVPYRALQKTFCTPTDPNSTLCVRPVLQDDAVAPDSTLLAQRAAFLRPDSLLAIVMLTDENDCSVIPAGDAFTVLQTDDFSPPMTRGSATCSTNPNHPCCHTCSEAAPAGCFSATETACDTPRLTPESDAYNLRCFEQRRRFGRDFLYPTQRYVNALRERRLCLSEPSLASAGCAEGELVDNPLFTGRRAPEDVVLAGVVGVPWQHLAAPADVQGQPLPEDVLRLKPSSELDWRAILGAPRDSPPVLPDDPFMRESTAPRVEVTPGNGINGREWDTALVSGFPDDLQYACIFPLPAPRDCTNDTGNFLNCDCVDGDTNKPLCEERPGNGVATTTQYWAKAYPGLRQLEVLQGLSDSSVVASICARNVTDTTRADFAYRPVFDAIAERVTRRLQP